MNEFKNKLELLEQFMKNDLPDIAGTEAVNHFAESFQNEGFTDRELKKWVEVQRRKATVKRNGKQVPNPYKGVKRTRKILKGDSGDLGESLTYDTAGYDVIISSDKPYARAHNQGADDAGRNHNVVIPQRQFAGPSETLNNAIVKEIEDFLNTLF